MPITNEKGLAALRALSTGGSAGLDAYKAAQASETASRTDALKGALGGMDVSAAAQAAQAKYAPKVASGGLGIDNLDVAANSYLSTAANKLAAQGYEDQQNLTYQAAALKAKQNEITEEERMNQLTGAADAWAAQQTGNVQADADLAGQLGNLATRKANLRNQLTAYDQGHGIPQSGIATPEMMAQREAERNAIISQMAGIDEQYNAASGQYAKFLGTDNKGLLERYNQADTGQADAVRQFLGEQGMRGMAEEAKGVRQRDIAMGTQGRLRDLAPAFGIDPLTAAGMFREGEGNDLARQSQIAKEQAFAEGDTKGQRLANLSEKLNIEDEETFGKALTRTGVSDDEAIDLLSGETGAIVERAFNAAINAPIGSDTYGEKGLVANLQSLAKEMFPDDEGKQAKFIQVADAYYGPKVKAVTGAGKVEEE